MAAYSYYKLNVTSADSGNGGTSTQLAEWAFYDSGGSAISTSGATMTGSTPFAGNVANVIDGNLTTGWCANGFTFPQYIQIQFPSAVSVDHFSLTSWNSGGAYIGPTYFSVQGSNDGSTWTTLFTYAAAVWSGSSQQTQTFYTTGIVYRLKITGAGVASTGVNGPAELAELAFKDLSGTSISTSTGTAIASHCGTTNVASKAFDGTGCSTYWESAGEDGIPSSGNPVWVGFQFPTVVDVGSIVLTSSTNYTLNPTAFTLQKSLDGATWTDVQGYTATWASACQTQTFTISSAPSITLSPNAGVQGNTYSVTVTGTNTNFISGVTTVSMTGSGVTISSVSVSSTTSLTFSLALSGTASLGAQTVTTTTGSEAPTATFTVLATRTCGGNTVEGNLAWKQLAFGPNGRFGDGCQGQSTDGSGLSGYLATWDSGGKLVRSTVATGTAGSGGTVTSVGLSLPSWLTVTGSPVTGSGTLTATAATGQTANRFLATPDGSTGAIGLRAIAAGDLPTATTSSLGAVKVDGSTITISGGVISSVAAATVVNKRATMWHDEATLLSGTGLSPESNSEYYGTDTGFSSAANGNAFTHSFVLAAGTFTLYVLGPTYLTFGKIDWYVDGVLQSSGQDWYSSSFVVNVVKSVSITTTTAGYHVLKGVVNGKNASSSGFGVAFTKYWIKPSAD